MRRIDDAGDGLALVGLRCHEMPFPRAQRLQDACLSWQQVHANISRMEWRNGEYMITTDPARIDRQAVQQFLADSYWAADRQPEIIHRSLDNSLAFGLFHGGRQVGMARVVSDYATFAWLCDVYIEPAHRGSGLGKWLMSVVMDHPELKGLRRWLLATRDAHALYEQFGFTELPDPKRLMIRNEVQSTA